ncbi:hypothetical protein GUITHDRAFT_139627 [Guillardia theta CCMP2712]|uniref:Uncharacterized protein n=1 Tax=Guillardia theta (strain CCMP2712) TaxID=905079 RepID=L1J840_GUITC|nr:hypothetical protein GUITHDRAFT_139627 [Guillardia theta CCMP2712]EKX44703.1 hypothetical protein GUITHDRAFT_139627 [Guillardia theta CCMP2712]|eukprot:XP_005831683.1 hypothetical protein GUITHDRAFT_139627 [Guillardia theta CCMP2712]
MGGWDPKFYLALVLVLLILGEHSSVSELHVHQVSDLIYVRHVPFNVILDISVQNVSRWKILIQEFRGREESALDEMEGEGDLNYMPFTVSWKRHEGVLLRVILLDRESERSWERAVHFQLQRLLDVAFQLSNPALSHHMAEVDASQPVVQDMLKWAVTRFWHSGRVSPTNVLEATVWLNFNPHELGQCQRREEEMCRLESSWETVHYLTVEWERGIFLFAVKMAVKDGSLSLLHAQPVPETLWSEKRTLSELVEVGTWQIKHPRRHGAALHPVRQAGSGGGADIARQEVVHEHAG